MMVHGHKVSKQIKENELNSVLDIDGGKLGSHSLFLMKLEHYIQVMYCAGKVEGKKSFSLLRALKQKGNMHGVHVHWLDLH